MVTIFQSGDVKGREMEKLNVTKICKGVGWDETSFFCWNCGMAGFSTIKKAIGHQAQCPAKVKNLGASPTNRPTNRPTTDQPDITTLPTDQPTNHRPYTIILPKPKTEIPASNTGLQLAGLVQDIAELKQDRAKWINEVPHLQAVQQAGFWGFTINQLIVMGVIAYLVYKVGQESTCRCSGSESLPRRTNGRLSSSIQDRVTDKAINYGISKLFK